MTSYFPSFISWSGKNIYKERNGTVLEVYLLLTSVLSVTLWGILSFNSTSRRQVYSPPWLTPTLFRKTGPSKIVEFSGSSETFALLINTPFLIKETFTSFASPWLPLSVMLQINLTLLPCSTMPTWEIATSGILLSKKQTIQTEFYLLARILPSLFGTAHEVKCFFEWISVPFDLPSGIFGWTVRIPDFHFRFFSANFPRKL